MKALGIFLHWSRPWERWYRQALPAYWMFLFLLTHLPNLKLQGAPPDSDKLAHFVAFGLLAFLFWRFFETFRRPPSPWLIWIALPVLLVYASLDEYLQQFVGRGTDVEDWVANIAGITCVLAALECRRRCSRAPEE